MSLFQTSFSHSLPLITLLPKAPENDILNAFKENEAPIFLEKGKKTPILDIIELEASPEKNLYFYNDVSISNPNLANLIENYLKGIPPNDQELQQLNDVEKDLFRCIRNKKIWTDEERNENKLLEKKMKKCGKRMEESQKLFFKKAYAFLEGIFFRNQMKNKKKIQKRHKNYSEFYYYYFAETAKRMDIDIENFYHPHKSFKTKDSKSKGKKSQEKKNIIPGQKSFNKTYIDLILNSKAFKKDLEFYLQNHFIKDCEDNRHRKILKFLSHCKKIKDDICLMHSITTPAMEISKKDILERLRSYILNDKKAKLPWSDVEITQAYNICKTLLGF